MLFIHPIWERFGGELSEYIPVGVPVAIGYLAQYLIQHGHKVKVHDEELTILDEEKNLICSDIDRLLGSIILKPFDFKLLIKSPSLIKFLQFEFCLDK